MLKTDRSRQIHLQQQQQQEQQQVHHEKMVIRVHSTSLENMHYSMLYSFEGPEKQYLGKMIIFLFINYDYETWACADPEGGDRGSGHPPPPWKITKL